MALTLERLMAQVLMRNLPDDVVARLKARAARARRSLEQELRDILVEAARPRRDEVLADMDRIRALTPQVPQTDSAELIREDRDRGWR
jgi:plasmid stability protein